MRVALTEIPGAFHLPRVDWGVVTRWIDQHVPQAERRQAWAEVMDGWLDALDAALGKNNRAVRSENLLLFAPGDFPHFAELLDFGEAGLAEIIGALGDLAVERLHGPLVILLFADVATYGRYTLPFDPQAGEFHSGGMCFRDGYTHIALRPGPLNDLQRGMLHEITHACLAHLNLPQWLEEGLTQMAEEAATPHWQRFSLTSEKASELRDFWRSQGLSEFWWGQGFHAFDEAQQFSYQLAEVVFRLILSQHRKQLPEFVRRACADDAGDGAARDVLGKGVATIAQQFLGSGNWEPVPPDSSHYIRRGAFFLDREQFDHALADFNKAVELDPQSYDTYHNRGTAHYLKGDYAAAKVDFERAMELNPDDFNAFNNLAWNLATAPEEQHRDGDRAVDLATKACERCGYNEWYCLATLGAAYAEIGEFEDALRWTREAARLAPKDERSDCQERIALFKAGKAYREVTRRLAVNGEIETNQIL